MDEVIINLTIPKNVINLMITSKSEDEWNNNCDKVKKQNMGVYPSFWFQEIILSGALSFARKRYGW